MAMDDNGNNSGSGSESGTARAATWISISGYQPDCCCRDVDYAVYYDTVAITGDSP